MRQGNGNIKGQWHPRQTGSQVSNCTRGTRSGQSLGGRWRMDDPGRRSLGVERKRQEWIALVGVAATGGDQGGAKMVDMHSATICPLECLNGQDLLHRMIEAFHCHLLTWFASQLMQPTIDRSFFLNFAKKWSPPIFLVPTRFLLSWHCIGALCPSLILWMLSPPIWLAANQFSPSFSPPWDGGLL